MHTSVGNFASYHVSCFDKAAAINGLRSSNSYFFEVPQRRFSFDITKVKGVNSSIFNGKGCTQAEKTFCFISRFLLYKNLLQSMARFQLLCASFEIFQRQLFLDIARR